MLTLKLPWPPSVNTYWRHIVIKGQARVLLSVDGRKYQANSYAAVREQIGMPVALTGRLRVSILVHPPDRRQRDLDNMSKAILDGLAHAGVYANDAQIDHLELIRGSLAQPKGGVEVTITETEAP